MRLSGRAPRICRRCNGRGIYVQAISRLPGATARQVCRRCGGRGSR